MDTFFQLSLVASYIAGVVALFAPCCITFLLPAYFANIFKEKKRVIFMTFIYSLGIFTIMLPVVLGVRALSSLFLRLHDQTYLIGGIFMILLGFSALLGLKLPMPKIAFRQKADDPISTYILGIISGITSSCCAPVLIGVITLSTLTPTIIQSLLVGFFYVLGMVTPLYLASLFIDKRNILDKPLFRQIITKARIGNRNYPILVSNFISFILFITVGFLAIFLTLSGKLSMKQGEDSIAHFIQQIAISVTGVTGIIPGLDVIFILLASYLLYKLIKNLANKK